MTPEERTQVFWEFKNKYGHLPHDHINLSQMKEILEGTLTMVEVPVPKLKRAARRVKEGSSGNVPNPAYLNSYLTHKWAEDQVAAVGLTTLLNVQVCGNSHDLSVPARHEWLLIPKPETEIFVLVAHNGDLNDPTFYILTREEFERVKRPGRFPDDVRKNVREEDLEEYEYKGDKC